MSQTTTVQELRHQGTAVANVPNVTLDMFSTQGFALAQRLALAYMSSNAVPMAFRSIVTKREKQGERYHDVEIENPAAMGNCLVAIETARAVGMSLTAVMQNADVIEGTLRWSGKFVIAAINASGRFTPLRFRFTNKGPIKAKYKEKGSWNRDERRYNMIEHEIEIENIECVAWAYTKENGRATQEIIEGAPVSMKMAVEEGWYSKPGSKWQGEMKSLMFQYRAGSFFGNIHAPDIIMGMGRTTEEAIDTIDATPDVDGTIRVDVDALRAQSEAVPNKPTKTRKDPPNTTDAVFTEKRPAATLNQDTGEVISNTAREQAKAEAGRPAPEAESSAPAYLDADKVMAAIQRAADHDTLGVAADGIQDTDPAQHAELSAAYHRRLDELDGARHIPQEHAKPTRTRRAAAADME